MSTDRTYHIRKNNSALWTRAYLDKKASKKLYDILTDDQFPLEVEPEVIVHAKKAKCHRRVGFFSDDSSGYRFAGQTAKSKPLTPELRDILIKVNEDLGTHFNGVLINHYRNGSDNIGFHSDDEKTLSEGTVACISLGVARPFRIWSKKKEKTKLDVMTADGQLLVMEGDFQKHYKHAIPVRKTIQGQRVSITFRVHKV